MWRIGWAPNSIPIYEYIQQDATLHSLFISGNCSTCFGWYFHSLSGAHTTVSTASGICHTVTAIWRYRGRVGTGLSVLWVAYAINVKSLNNTSKWQMGFTSEFKGLMQASYASGCPTETCYEFLFFAAYSVSRLSGPCYTQPYDIRWIVHCTKFLGV
jgi:hypothetical protein